MTPDPVDAPPPQGRVTLVVTSPRSAPGLLTWAGWDRLRRADEVLAVDPDPAWLAAFDEAGVEVTDVAGLGVAHRAGRLVEEASPGRDLVWWGSPDGDPGLTDALAGHLSRRSVAGHPPEVEVLTAAPDVPGSRMLDLVAVMNQLRSPGGSSWDAAQTHVSLLPFLLEETHEVIEAVQADDRAHLVEELGDLLLQVVFHARIGQDGSSPFDIDDVAAGIVGKLVRRNPHVFAAGGAERVGGGSIQAGGLSPAEVEQRWEEAKAVEKPGRHAFEGIPVTLPALARAQKMLGRLTRVAVGGGAVDLPGAVTTAAAGDAISESLLIAVLTAVSQGVDAEQNLRAALTRMPAPGPGPD